MDVKQFIHKSFRLFGFDIVSLRNIDEYLEKRDRQRKESYAERLAGARLEYGDPGSRAYPSDDGSTGIIYVNAGDLMLKAQSRLKDAHTILDIGCGINPQVFVDAAIHICCEPFKEYMSRLMAETVGNQKYVYLECDLVSASSLFPARSVDTIFLMDVIEHLERSAAKICLERFSRIARSQVAVFTPIGFMPQHYRAGEKDRWGMNGGSWQEHKSGWLPEDFPAAEGWEVIACREFHMKDDCGRDLETPCGAMWAIRNLR